MQLDVSFFVTPEQLPHSVTWFNVMTVIANSHPECSLDYMFRSAFVKKNDDQINNFSDVLKVTVEDGQESVVKTRGGDAILKARKISDKSCKASLGYLDERRPMIFLQFQFVVWIL